MGDPDLSSPEASSDVPEGLAGRGLVVFPAPERARRRNLSWYAPFLITIAIGVIVVLVAALVR